MESPHATLKNRQRHRIERKIHMSKKKILRKFSLRAGLIVAIGTAILSNWAGANENLVATCDGAQLLMSGTYVNKPGLGWSRLQDEADHQCGDWFDSAMPQCIGIDGICQVKTATDLSRAVWAACLPPGGCPIQ